MNTTTDENTATAKEVPRLTGKLGVFSISLMIIAGAAPLCVVGGPMVLGLALGNGTGLPVGYLVTLVVLLLFVIGFTTMAPFVRSSGAFYSYVHAGLGRAAGIGTGYLAMLSYTCVFIGLFTLFGTGVDTLVKSYGGPELPWWLWFGVGLAMTSFLGYRDVELSGKVLGILLLAEVSVVLMLDLSIVARGGGPEGLSRGVFSVKAIFSGAPGVGIIFAVLSFIGIEAAAVFRDEARDPARTVRRATVLSVIVVGLFYTLTSWAVISGVGDSRVVQAAAADPEGLLSSVALQYLGRVGEDLTVAMFVTSTFAAALTWHNILARYTFSLASRGLLPTALSVNHPKHGSPHRGAMAITVVAGAVLVGGVAIGLEPMSEIYTWTTGLGSIGYIVLLVLTCAAVLAFFRRDNRGASMARTLIAPLLGMVGLLAILAIMLLNLDLLAGSNAAVSAVLIGSLVVAFALGPVVGKLLPTSGRQE